MFLSWRFYIGNGGRAGGYTYLEIYIPLSRSSQDSEVQGVIPRAVKDIFNYIRENKSTEYLVKVMSNGFLRWVKLPSLLRYLRWFISANVPCHAGLYGLVPLHFLDCESLRNWRVLERWINIEISVADPDNFATDSDPDIISKNFMNFIWFLFFSKLM